MRISSWRELQLRNNGELPQGSPQTSTAVLRRSWISLQGFPGTERPGPEQQLRGDKLVLVGPEPIDFAGTTEETEVGPGPWWSVHCCAWPGASGHLFSGLHGVLRQDFLQLRVAKTELDTTVPTKRCIPTLRCYHFAAKKNKNKKNQTIQSCSVVCENTSVHLFIILLTSCLSPHQQSILNIRQAPPQSEPRRHSATTGWKVSASSLLNSHHCRPALLLGNSFHGHMKRRVLKELA